MKKIMILLLTLPCISFAASDLFTDDFEKIVNRNYNTELNIGKTNEHKDCNAYINQYIKGNLIIKINIHRYYFYIQFYYYYVLMCTDSIPGQDCAILRISIGIRAVF